MGLKCSTDPPTQLISKAKDDEHFSTPASPTPSEGHLQVGLRPGCGSHLRAGAGTISASRPADSRSLANAVGLPLHPGNLRTRSYLPLLERAGVPRLRFHDLRHTTATLLLGEGIHPKVVSEMLGHSTITIILDLHSHVTHTMQHDAVNTLDAMLFAPLAVKSAVNEEDEDATLQVSPRSSGDRASVS
jgi:Phage integrase family